MPRRRNHVVRDGLPACRGGVHRQSKSGQRRAEQQITEDALGEYLEDCRDEPQGQPALTGGIMESEKRELWVRDD